MIEDKVKIVVDKMLANADSQPQGDQTVKEYHKDVIKDNDRPIENSNFEKQNEGEQKEATGKIENHSNQTGAEGEHMMVVSEKGKLYEKKKVNEEENEEKPPFDALKSESLSKSNAMLSDDDCDASDSQICKIDESTLVKENSINVPR